MQQGKIVSIQVGRPKRIESDRGTWVSAFIKEPVSGPVRLDTLNLAGDQQADLDNHGGPDQAVLGYSADHYPGWRDELGCPDFSYGAFGENFTIEGLDETTVCIGDVFETGTVTLQVTNPRGPCWKISRRHGIPDLTARVQKTSRTGWYYRVLQEGDVEAGQALTLIDRPYPVWTIARTSAALYGRKRDPETLEALFELPPLGARWRVGAWRLLAKVR